MAAIKVAILGATGRTGQIIIDGLQASETNFDIVALARASSIDSAANQALREKGVEVSLADLSGPHQDLVKVLEGVDIVISAIVWNHLDDQIPLAKAAKGAGVGRFVPCFWGPAAPRGVKMFMDMKLDSLAEIQQIYLPYTVIDVGWWSQQMIPKLPSGRIDHAAFEAMLYIPGDGNIPLALTDYRDIGAYTAKIITDPRTLNKFVFAYTEVMTFNEVMSLLHRLSGEKPELPYRSGEEIRKDIASAAEALKTKPDDWQSNVALIIGQYLNLLGVRGDNTPEKAKYLGYLDFKELYPEANGNTMESILIDVLAGKPSGYVNPSNYSIMTEPAKES